MKIEGKTATDIDGSTGISVRLTTQGAHHTCKRKCREENLIVKGARNPRAASSPLVLRLTSNREKPFYFGKLYLRPKAII